MVGRTDEIGRVRQMTDCFKNKKVDNWVSAMVWGTALCWYRINDLSEISLTFILQGTD